MPTDLSFSGQTTGKVVNLETDTWSTVTKILPLGDSLTYGYQFGFDNNAFGYRYWLQQMMVQSGYRADFVGPFQNGFSRMLDRDHAGTPGITAPDLQDNVADYMATYHPDVVLLLIGTNDIMEANAGTVVPQEIRNVLNTIQASQPGVKIIVSSLPPIPPDTPLGSQATVNIAAVNAALPAMIAQAQAAGINVSLMPIPGIVAGTDQVDDGVHLNDVGYAKFAEYWFNALLAQTNMAATGTPLGVANAITSDVVNITGGSGGDTITGDARVNIINGGAGNDTIRGGLGADNLTGGSGVDYFIYVSPSEGGDTITDFNTTQDEILVSAATFQGLAVNTNVTIRQSNTPTGTGGQFLYSGGVLSWDPDGTGAQAAVVIATFTGNPSLGTDDFVVTGDYAPYVPVVSVPLLDQHGVVGQVFSFVVPPGSFTDGDNDPLTLSATGMPSWMTFNAATGTFSGTPTGAAANTNVTVRATDPTGRSVTDVWQVQVRASNAAPVVANPLVDKVIAPGGALSYQFLSNTFTDANNDTLTYTAKLADGSALPSWLVFNAATRTFSGTAPVGFSGNLNVRVTANDGWGGTNFDDFTVTVGTNHSPTVANPISAQAATEDAPFSFAFAANTFADSDGDTLTYSATLSSGAALPSWLTFNAATRTFSGTPLQANVGSITVRVTANDGHGATVTNDFVINTANVNDAPIVAVPVGAQAAPEDSAFSFVVPAGTFTDEDGDALTYSATLSSGAALPSWLSFNAATRTFSGTPLQANVGSITVRVTANDGHGGTTFTDFVINTANVNDAPVVATPIGAQSAPEDSPFSFVVPAGTFTDEDGDTLAYSATLSSGAALPSWLTFNTTTRTFSGTPLQANVGSITVRVTANDGHGGTNFADFVINTANVNDAPVVATPIGAQSAPEDSAFSFVVPAGTFADQDGDALTYSATLSSGAALPSWLSFNAATRTFSGTPLQTNVGSITVRVSVSDGNGGSTFTDFVINTANVNDAPVVAAPIGAQAATEDSPFSFIVPAGTFTDEDGDTLTYSATLSSGAALPTWLTFNAATRTFSGTPLQANVGATTVRVTANDGHGGTNFTDFAINTANVNDAPIVANPIPNGAASEASPYSFTFAANAFSDEDGDALTYSATLSSGAALPAWLSFNPATRTFSGTPSASDVGTIIVRVTANDGHGGTVVDDFNLVIGGINHAPTVANPISTQSAPEDSAFSFIVPANTFADSDAGDTLTYSATLSSGAALPSWLVFNAATRTFSGTPLQANVGAITVRVTANDGHGGTVFNDFVINTANVNDAPIVANAIPNGAATEASPYSFTFAANAFSDEDGDALTYSATLSSGAALPSWLAFNAATRTFSGTPGAGDTGTITVRVTANDGHGGTITDDFNLVIGGINHAPTVANPIAAQAAPEDSPFSFAFAANTFADTDAGDTLTYSATLSSGAALPSWLVFNAATRTFSGTPLQANVGAITVRVTANDGHGGAVFNDFVINTANVNDAPTVATPIGAQAAPEDSAFSFIVPAGTFTDQDGDALTYSATLSSGAALPSWLSFNAATRTFSGTPLQANVGSITVRVTANDGHGGTGFTDIVINTANVNDAPVVAAPIGAQSAPEDSAFSFIVPAGTFTDEDGDALTYSATLSSGAALPSWLTFNAATRSFSGTPLQANVGSITVRVTANDGHGGTNFTDFVVNTANVNDAPVIATPLADQTATQNAAFSFVVPAAAFTDQDGDALTYTATLSSGAALPTWLTFNATTRTFSGTPGAGDIGAITVRVTANDGHGGTGFDDFIINTSSAATNTPPVVANPIADQTGTDNVAFSFAMPANSFSDANGDTLTYTATLASGAALPSWLTFNAATRTFSGTPLAGASGVTTVRVTANDGHGGTVFDDFNITIAPTPVSVAYLQGVTESNALDEIFTYQNTAYVALNAGVDHDTLIGSQPEDYLEFFGGAAATTYTLSVVTQSGVVGVLMADTQNPQEFFASGVEYWSMHTATGAGDTTFNVVNGLFDGGVWYLYVTSDAGNDTFRGNDEDDNFIAGAGNDTYYGSVGNDAFDGGAGTDTADYSSVITAMTLTANGATQFTTHDQWGQDTITTAEILKLGSGNDTGTLATSITTAYGNNGNDTITASASATTIYGGAGTDTLNGAAGADKLYGEAGNDTLSGGAGNDRLEGGAGADRLTGGANNDTFAFTNIGDSITGAADTITDFVTGTDKIDLAALDANTGVAGDQAFAIVASHTSNAAAQIVISGSGTSWVVTGYVDGDNTADLIINITGSQPVVGDFLL